jgi:hypothetical protein
MTRYVTIVACCLLALAGLAQAQNTTTLSVVVGPEAALTVTTGTTSLATASTTFGNPCAGTTSLTYLIRTTKSTGSGTVTLKITADFITSTRFCGRADADRGNARSLPHCDATDGDGCFRRA